MGIGRRENEGNQTEDKTGHAPGLTLRGRVRNQFDGDSGWAQRYRRFGESRRGELISALRAMRT